MSDVTHRGGGIHVGATLSLDEVRAILPELDGLRPLLERLEQVAEPDASRRWAGSAEVESLGDRRVDPVEVDRELELLVQEVRFEAERSFRAGLRALRKVSERDLEGAASELRLEAERRVRDGRLAEAEAFLACALRLTERFMDRRAALPVHLAAARVARARGHLGRAEEHYRLVLRLGEAAGDLPAALTAAVGLGNLEVDRGRWTAAEVGYARAQGLLERIPGSRPERWHLALNRSILAREEGALARAWELLLEADERAREMGDTGAAPIIENARGQVLLAMAEPEAAEAAFRRALAVAHHPDARVTIGVNLADALLARGRLLEAGGEARRAEELAVRAGIGSRLPEVYRVLGEVAAASENPEGFIFFERALDIVRTRDLPQVERARVLEPYARAERARGHGHEAETLAAEARAIRAALREGGGT
jgi:tetratricopeptide (TPR) repeat protein